MQGFGRQRDRPRGRDGAATLARDAATFAARPDAIWAAVGEKTRSLLLARLRTVLWLALASFAIFFAFDLASPAAPIVPLAMVKAAQVAVAVGTLWALRTRAARSPVGLAVVVFSLLAVLASASAILRGNATSTMGLYVIFTIGAAMSLPWGVWPQAAGVGIFTVTLAWSLYAVDGTLASLVSPASGTVLTAGLVSIYLARDAERYRYQIEQAESELRRSEASLAALIESSTDPVCSVDREGRLVVMNSAVPRAYGVEAHPGQRFEDLAPAELKSAWQELSGRALAGEPLSTEQRVERDGATRHYLISMCPIREGGEVTGATMLSRDITDLRQTEALARRNQTELTHALRLATIGEISSTLAHEINQPLGAISNYASACVRRIDSGSMSAPDLKRGLELIATEALRAGEIIRGIRDLGRKGEGEPADQDLNDIVRQAVLVTEPEARLQGVDLKLDTAEHPLTIYGDRVRIQQVVLNLILNGIEAMQSSLEKRLSIRTARTGNTIAVAVRDSGAGLDTSLGEAIFEPFFTTKPRGLGMGLAISRRIIEAHGGQLGGTANEDGRGSTFSFTLPAVS